MLTATPIAFAYGSGHDIDRAAFDARTTLRNAGGVKVVIWPFRHDAPEPASPPVTAVSGVNRPVYTSSGTIAYSVVVPGRWGFLGRETALGAILGFGSG